MHPFFSVTLFTGQQLVLEAVQRWLTRPCADEAAVRQRRLGLKGLVRCACLPGPLDPLDAWPLPCCAHCGCGGSRQGAWGRPGRGNEARRAGQYTAAERLPCHLPCHLRPHPRHHLPPLAALLPSSRSLLLRTAATGVLATVLDAAIEFRRRQLLAAAAADPADAAGAAAAGFPGLGLLSRAGVAAWKQRLLLGIDELERRAEAMGIGARAACVLSVFLASVARRRRCLRSAAPRWGRCLQVLTPPPPPHLAF